MNQSTKCNCCCKESVCKYKEQYEADREAIIKAIRGATTEVKVTCNEMIPNSQTRTGDIMTEQEKAIEELSDIIGDFYDYMISQYDANKLATAITEKGYSKQSDTAREFAGKAKVKLKNTFTPKMSKFCGKTFTISQELNGSYNLDGAEFWNFYFVNTLN